MTSAISMSDKSPGPLDTALTENTLSDPESEELSTPVSASSPPKNDSLRPILITSQSLRTENPALLPGADQVTEDRARRMSQPKEFHMARVKESVNEPSEVPALEKRSIRFAPLPDQNQVAFQPNPAHPEYSLSRSRRFSDTDDSLRPRASSDSDVQRSGLSRLFRPRAGSFRRSTSRESRKNQPANVSKFKQPPLPPAAYDEPFLEWGNDTQGTAADWLQKRRSMREQSKKMDESPFED